MRAICAGLLFAAALAQNCPGKANPTTAKVNVHIGPHSHDDV